MIRTRHKDDTPVNFPLIGAISMTISTIGYEKLDIDAFVSLLKEHEVDTVVDIRELPLSRKPGFSKKALTNILSLAGLEYIHMVELGCPKLVRDRYRKDGNWNRYTEGFLKHLETQEFAIAGLSDVVMFSNCALLCYEADHNFCHRSMVANAVSDYCGASVQHIKTGDVRIAGPASLRLILS